MSIIILTANLGNFDKRIPNVEQTISHDFYRFTDENFPPRYGSMTSRLQARIPKMMGWQMKPGYDYYVWVDASCILSDRNSLKWLLMQCENVDFAVLKHPKRNSIKEEADYLKKRLEKKCEYVTPRYENELIDEQLEIINSDKEYVDDHFFASTVMVYKNTDKVHKALKNWFYHTARYHSIDQLSLPYVIWKAECSYNIIPGTYMNSTYIEYVRVNKKYDTYI